MSQDEKFPQLAVASAPAGARSAGDGDAAWPDPGSGGAAAYAQPPQLRLESCALFLDVDGTLLEFAAAPDAVVIDPELRELLHGLVLCSGGALALVSGRSIADLDALFEPLQLSASGLHGFERRNAAGLRSQHSPPEERTLEEARRRMRQLARRDARLTLEDKGIALALHYRGAPLLESTIVPAVLEIATRLGERLAVRRGRMVIELLPQGVNKAGAIAEFMREPPFAGRRPLFVGDDLTDECAFEWVNAAGGVSVAVDVSRPTAARARLQSVREVRGWLQRLLALSGNRS